MSSVTRVSGTVPNVGFGGLVLLVWALFLSLPGQAQQQTGEINGPNRAYRIGNGVSAPTVIYKVEPTFSEEARRLGIEGTAVIFLVVRQDGMPYDLHVIKSVGHELDEKAMEAVRQWRFKPGELNGVAVPVQVTIEVNFRLLPMLVTSLVISSPAQVIADPETLAAATRLDKLGFEALRRRDLGEAENYYRQALSIREKLAPSNLDMAMSLDNLGHVASQRGDLAKAEEYYQQSLVIKEKLAPGSLNMAMSLNGLGATALRRDDLAKAEEYYQQAIAIGEKRAPGSLSLAVGLRNLGVVALKQGDLSKAEEYHQRALAIRQQLAPGGLGVAESLNDLGDVANAGLDPSKAERYYQQALAIRHRLEPDSLAEAISLMGLGKVVSQRGDLAKAEENYQQALAIRQRLVPDSLTVGETMNSLGILFSSRGDLAKAEEYHQQDLAIERKLAPGSLYLAFSLNNLGLIARKRGDLTKAQQDYQQALVLEQKLAPASLDNPPLTAIQAQVVLAVAGTLDNLGVVASERRDVEKAEKYYQQALALKQKFAPRSLALAASLDNLGNLASDRGDLIRAEDYYRRAERVFSDLSPGSQNHATSLYRLGTVVSRKGQRQAAAKLFLRSLDDLENQVSHLGGTEEDRSSFRASNMSPYKDYISLLLDLEHSAEAFGVVERSRARSFVEMLASRDLAWASALPSDIQQARQRNASAYDRAMNRLTHLSPEKDAEQVVSLRAELKKLGEERGQIVEQIKKVSPRYGALQYPQPLNLIGSRQALDSGTTLLSYSVGADKTTLFVVQSAGTDPGLTVISIPINEKELRSQVDSFRHSLEQPSESSRAAVADQCRRLYDLLIRPAESLLADSKRLLIVPDGPLHLLPFAALKRNESQYLIEWKPLHLTVSATVYAELRKMRQKDNNGPVEVAAFGDPQYQAADSKQTEETRNLELRLALDGGFRFGRLAFSRGEVNNICDLYPGHCQKYLGAEATEERAKSLDKQVRYVHFATHAYLDEKLPLNSAVVLSIPEKLAEGQENGLLQAWEIFDQVRLDADLVVLSACKTALGQEVNGEGLIGLTRAFHYAGARSVLASLWNVEDFRTAELMQEFYRHLRKGESKDQALREAQLRLLHARSSSHPYYWAAFTLSGDWR